MSRPTVAIVFGGRSPEHEVSIVSGRGIYEHIDRSRYEVVLVGVDRQGRPRVGGQSLLHGGLERGEGVAARWPASPADRAMRAETTGETLTPPLDVVFPIVHGPGGEDGTLQGVLELAGIPCVGAGVLGSSLAMDKDISRQLLAARGFPVVETVVVRQHELDGGNEWRPRVLALGLPLFVKPARSGSSVGITRVTAPEQLDRAVEAASSVDSKVLFEQAVLEPREIEVSVLGLDEPQASVPGEIVPHGEFYDYRAKYEDPESRLIIPAPLAPDLAARTRSLAVDAFAALDLAGLARVDFLLSRADGALVLNEINTLPGFTPISMYPRLWEESGLPYARMLDRLIELAPIAASRSPLAPGR